MKYQIVAAAAMAGIAQGRLIMKREVPQEHSHNIYLDIVREFLALDNPKGIVDPVFGFLGNAAAVDGAGDVTNLDCLKQETADQAFTNAKAISDTRGMAGALVFQALERNTASVGVKSAECTDEAVNAEIAALVQHQDPASDNAAAENKDITLELAKQLALIGADPLLALESGTFAPGDVDDPTGAGNSCDTEDDDPGCIFSERLLVLDATPDEISAAVDGIEATFTGTGVISATNIDLDGLDVATATGDVEEATTTAEEEEETATETAEAGTTECTIVSTSCSAISTTVAATATDEVLASITSGAEVTATAAGANIQAFTGTLGGSPPPVVSAAGDRPFSVNGNSFTGQGAALSRSCDIQHNACANAANSGDIDGGAAQCETQLADCKAANALKIRARKVAAEKAALRRRMFKINHRRQATDFGSCSDPTIIFAEGLDGRSTAAFAPNNGDDFNHGSANAIGVISGFICQQLEDKCEASEDAVSLCNDADAAAKEATQDQAAADKFNEILTGDGATPTDGEDEEPTATEQVVAITITQCA
ncbi:hypothetical protein MKZ38_008636 [Zalerion maritima]|uniref:Cell wall mannoprotein n=1 Tax=Zalerion maritima TaxID=339359 RepID=A0AAD5WVF3_9PEZI|nr:hypothetical protein MKZ38_008636 [Zalerion maritima]